MTNPYEVTSTVSSTTISPWRYALAFIAGIVGYGTLIVTLGLTAWLSHGRTAALDNLGRVVRIHRELSLNTIAANTPNIALAILASIATTKWIHSQDSQSRCWMLAGITVIGYVIVLLFTRNLIPWMWPNELSNGVRSALTLLFPLVAYVVASIVDRRTKR